MQRTKNQRHQEAKEEPRIKHQISTNPSKDVWCLYWKVVVKEKLQNSNWFT
jgi:hypothetical protein